MDDAQYLALARHGKSFANADLKKAEGELYYSVSGSDLDVDITPEGVNDCERTALLLARLFPTECPLSKIWLSDFRRIKRSSTIMAGKLGYSVPTMVDSRFNKRSYGLFWNLTYAGVRTLHPEQNEIFERLGPLRYRPPGGENYYDLFERVDDAFYNTLDQTEGNQLVVGHSAVLLAMKRRLDGLSDLEVVRMYETLAIPNGYLMLYRRAAPGQPWQRVNIADLLWGDRLDLRKPA